ncbi:hypothetical protein V1264_016619 [Littorina saxatilis]|uniref:Uncharacterized protein n=1 Tax=Littorina saxatilis TaxID=31220 RepID=A0AAN9GEB5_9CAEN
MKLIWSDTLIEVGYPMWDISRMQITPQNTLAFHKDNNNLQHFKNCISFIRYYFNNNSTNTTIINNTEREVSLQRRTKCAFPFLDAIFAGIFTVNLNISISIE